VDKALHDFEVYIVVVVEVLVVEDVLRKGNPAFFLQQSGEQNEKGELIELHSVYFLLYRLSLGKHTIGTG
jgi:hypothetical protein